MRRIFPYGWTIVSVMIIPLGALALTFPDIPPESDRARDIEKLVDAGVIHGYPDGTFRPDIRVNRAEFITMTMRGLQSKIPPNGVSCFPDVPPDVWFAGAACAAKTIGLIEGRTIPGKSKRQFVPEDNLLHAEALKILLMSRNISFLKKEGTLWYLPIMTEASLRGWSIPHLDPLAPLRRSEVATILASLPLRTSQSSSALSIPPPFPLSASSFSSALSLSSKTSLQSSSFQVDLYDDTDVLSHLLLLGRDSSVLGSVNVFPNEEPLDVRHISIDFIDPPTSIHSLMVYDEDRRFLGFATLDTTVSGNRRFTLNLLGNTIVIPKREGYSFYVRAKIKRKDEGGVSGEIVQVQQFRIEGDGIWSNETYVKSSTESFPPFQITRARFTRIVNAEEATGTLPLGSMQRLGVFQFDAEQSDGSAEVSISSLIFQVSTSPDITIGNPTLRGRDAAGTSSCTISGLRITCAGLSMDHGFIGATRVIELFADVTLSGTGTSPSLQFSINVPGTVDDAGDITWTDGTSTFQWVQFEQPVVRGIRLR